MCKTPAQYTLMLLLMKQNMRPFKLWVTFHNVTISAKSGGKELAQLEPIMVERNYLLAKQNLSLCFNNTSNALIGMRTNQKKVLVCADS